MRTAVSTDSFGLDRVGPDGVREVHDSHIGEDDDINRPGLEKTRKRIFEGGFYFLLATPNLLVNAADVIAVRAITVRHPCLKTPSSTALTVAQHYARFKADKQEKAWGV
jgi:hypothetical protein